MIPAKPWAKYWTTKPAWFRRLFLKHFDRVWAYWNPFWKAKCGLGVSCETKCGKLCVPLSLESPWKCWWPPSTAKTNSAARKPKPVWQGQTPKPFNLKMFSELVQWFRQNLEPNIGLQNRFTGMKVSLKTLMALRIQNTIYFLNGHWTTDRVGCVYRNTSSCYWLALFLREYMY